MKTRLRQLTRVALLAVISIAACGTASAATLVVTSAADDGGGDTLRDAIAAAQPGDTIVFDPSLNGQTIVLTNGHLSINKSLDIEGPGADLLAISANFSDTVFTASGTGPVTIAGLTIRDGDYYSTGLLYPAGGSGICNYIGSFLEDSGESLTLRDCNITGNRGYVYGGGIYNAGRLAISGCIITGNSANPPSVHWADGQPYSFGGGVYNDSMSSVTIADSLVSDNVSWDGEGGGIYNGGLMDIRNSSVSNNHADNDGGGIYNGFGQYNLTPTLTMTNCTVSGNAISGYLGSGGGIANEWNYYYDSGGAVTLFHCSVTGNYPNNLDGTIVVLKDFYWDGDEGGLVDLKRNIVWAIDPGFVAGANGAGDDNLAPTDYFEARSIAENYPDFVAEWDGHDSAYAVVTAYWRDQGYGWRLPSLDEAQGFANDYPVSTDVWAGLHGDSTGYGSYFHWTSTAANGSKKSSRQYAVDGSGSQYRFAPATPYENGSWDGKYFWPLVVRPLEPQP